MDKISVQKKNDDPDYEVTLFDEIHFDITDDEALQLMWDLAKLLGYETRSKW